MNPILTESESYERRLCESLVRGTSSEHWWPIAVGMKLLSDAQTQYRGKALDAFLGPNPGLVISDHGKFVEDLKSALGGSVKMSRTKKKEDAFYYRLSFSNFQITLITDNPEHPSRYRSDPYLLVADSYYSIRIWIEFSAEDFAAWLLHENEMIPAFRADFEEHVTQMQKRIMSGSLDTDMAEAVLRDELSDLGAKISVERGFVNEGRITTVTCQFPDLPEASIVVPAGFTNWSLMAEMLACCVNEEDE